MAIKWDNNYRIGNNAIDKEHESLFNYLSILSLSTDKDARIKSLMNLFQYTRIHFSNEEKLMVDIDYPEIKNHVILHNDLLTKLSDLSYKISNNEEVSNMNIFIHNWLVNHILNEDTKIALYIK